VGISTRRELIGQPEKGLVLSPKTLTRIPIWRSYETGNIAKTSSTSEFFTARDCGACHLAPDPVAAHAQGSPFDNGFTALQTLFTGTIAKVASLIAIVGGYQFAHGEPGGKKALAGVAAGTGIAVLAANVLTWLWGV